MLITRKSAGPLDLVISVLHCICIYIYISILILHGYDIVLTIIRYRQCSVNAGNKMEKSRFSLIFKGMMLRKY